MFLQKINLNTLLIIFGFFGIVFGVASSMPLLMKTIIFMLSLALVIFGVLVEKPPYDVYGEPPEKPQIITSFED